MLYLLINVLLAFVQSPTSQESDLVRSVEQQRGGRHWIDQATDPPKSPEESLKCLQVEPGCRVELVAAEPLVLDPVALEFDHQGRMFVAEYSDYPVGPPDPAAPRLSRIVLLEDTNNDGCMDRRTVFADDLAFCHSVLPLFDGILTCTETEILFLKDTDGDNVADLREVWYSGFTPAHPQMQIGCPRWGFDNWIYLTYGPGKIRCERPGFETSEPVVIPRNDFRFHPLTMQFEAVTGLGQFGNTFDNDGHRFFSTNRNPAMTDVLPLNAVRRNPWARLVTGHTDVGPAGEDTRVFPLVTMKSNWLSHAGTHTSACGVTAYRGNLFDATFQRSLFACEPVGHLVTRSITEPQGATLTAVRARPKADFLASTDTWFRPASLNTGPDGSLYLADMYRLWVEHPKFVPDDVANKMDWRAGEDRGRIWRIIPDQDFAFQSLPETDSWQQLVSLLRDPSGWRRLLGQRLLVERQQNEAVDQLRVLLRDASADGHSRMQALWTLDGLGQVSDADLMTALADNSALVRRDAIRIASERSADNHSLQQRIADCCGDPNAEVRLQAMLAMADSQFPEKGEILGRAAVDGASDAWLGAAILSSSKDCSGKILEQLVPAWNQTSTDAIAIESGELRTRTDLLRQLAFIVAARGDDSEFKEVLKLISAGSAVGSWWQTALLIGVSQGLPGTQGANLQKSLSDLLSNPPADIAEIVEPIRSLMLQAADAATDATRPEADRIAAIQLLPFQSLEVMSETVSALLQSNQPLICQLAALDAIRQSGRAELALQTLDNWNSLRPQVRSQALDLLLTRKETVSSLLHSMSDGLVSPSVVSIEQRLRLLQSADAGTRELAGKLFGGTVSADRRQVADQYAEALTLKGSVAEGAKVFAKSCSKCHRIDGVGHQVGPDISDTRNRARDALLYDILDPNRRVDPQFTDYVVVTTDGRTFNGLLAAETADSVDLLQSEAIRQSLPRRDIEELRSTNRSLMPEGIEKDVTVQQMADLLEFLKSR